MEQTKEQRALVDIVKKQVIRFLIIISLIDIIFLFLRFFFHLIGVRSESLFGSFIYLISDFILLPFFRAFPRSESPLAGSSSLDTTAVLALFVYLIFNTFLIALTLLISAMLKIFTRVPEVKEEKTTTTSPDDPEGPPSPS